MSFMYIRFTMIDYDKSDIHPENSKVFVLLRITWRYDIRQYETIQIDKEREH